MPGRAGVRVSRAGIGVIIITRTEMIVTGSEEARARWSHQSHWFDQLSTEPATLSRPSDHRRSTTPARSARTGLVPLLREFLDDSMV